MQARENIVWMLRILCEESHASLVKIQRRKKIESSSICNCPHLVHAENHDHIASILQANSFLGAIQNVDFMDWHLDTFRIVFSNSIPGNAIYSALLSGTRRNEVRKHCFFFTMVLVFQFLWKQDWHHL